MEAISILGATMLIFAYLAMASGRMNPKGNVFQCLNVGGAALLLWYFIHLGDAPMQVLEGTFFFGGVFFLLRQRVHGTSRGFVQLLRRTL